jgi:hypothetical protein
MSDPNLSQSPETDTNSLGQPFDPLKQEMLLQSLRDKQRFGLSIGLGLLAAIAGALIWALISHLANRQMGWMAIGLGFGVAFTIRTVGQGIEPRFGYCSAGLSLLGCLLGNMIFVAKVIADKGHDSLSTVLTVFFSHPQFLPILIQATYEPMDLLFYGLAMYTGYKYAFRTITLKELKEIST